MSLAGLCIHHSPSLCLFFSLSTSWAGVLKTSCPSYSVCCVNTSTELHIDNELKRHWALAQFRGPGPTWDAPSVPGELVFYGVSDGRKGAKSPLSWQRNTIPYENFALLYNLFILMHVVYFSMQSLFPFLAWETPCEAKSHAVHSADLSQHLLSGVRVYPLSLRGDWIMSSKLF